MKFLTLFTVAATAGFAAAQTVMVNTPGQPVTCVPTLITWTGGQGPFTLEIQTPDANGAIIQQYGPISGDSFSWPTNITAPTTIGITVVDSTGATGKSGMSNVSPGTSTSCINAAGSSSPAAGSSTPAAGSSTPAAGSSTSAATSGATSSTGSPATVGSGTGSSTAPHSTAPSSSGSSSGASPSTTGGSSNGAMGNAAAMGAVGFIGAVVAAIMA